MKKNSPSSLGDIMEHLVVADQSTKSPHLHAPTAVNHHGRTYTLERAMFERNSTPEIPSEGVDGTDSEAVIASIMAGIPTRKSVLTVSHEQVRTGLLVRWVQQCSENPVLLSVAIPTGESVIPIIRNSRRFTLCQVDDDDTFLTRKFARPHEPGEDPFMGLPITIGDAEVPIITRARSYLECLLVGHMELGADHRLYVGKVIGGGMLGGASINNGSSMV